MKMSYGQVDLGGFRAWLETIAGARAQFIKDTGRQPTHLVMPVAFLGTSVKEIGNMAVVFAAVDKPLCALTAQGEGE